MPNKTPIEWTDFSSNPLKLRLSASGKVVNACIPVSPGCQNCYASNIVGRWWPQEQGKYPGYGASLLKLGKWELSEAELHKMLTFRPKPPFKHGSSRPRVFVCDMTDLFGEWVPFDFIDRMFAIFALRPDVDWQILTKRPERMAEYLLHRRSPMGHKTEECIAAEALDFCCQARVAGSPIVSGRKFSMDGPVPWPLENVWLGCSVEDQKRADERREHLRACPAAVKFVSYEPALGPVDWTGWEFVQQIISGGESGPDARPAHPEWFRGTRDYCVPQGIAYFHKQNGAYEPVMESDDALASSGNHVTLFANGQTAFNDEQKQLVGNGKGLPGVLSVVGRCALLSRVGKHTAGRLLDGREWNEFPASPVTTSREAK